MSTDQRPDQSDRGFRSKSLKVYFHRKADQKLNATEKPHSGLRRYTYVYVYNYSKASQVLQWLAAHRRLIRTRTVQLTLHARKERMKYGNTKVSNRISFVQPKTFVLKESHSWRARPSRSRKVRNSPKEPRLAFLVTWLTIPLREKQWDFVLRTQSSARNSPVHRVFRAEDWVRGHIPRARAGRAHASARGFGLKAANTFRG